MENNVSSNKPTACLALSDGTLFFGKGFGATGETTAELCFNTSITGYQEILTDPSYASQIVTFTFPHIGNVGVNTEDAETENPAAEGLIVKWDPTQPSNWRSLGHLSDWLRRYNLLGMGGVDTRRLTRSIRMLGAPHVALAHNPSGDFNTAELTQKAKSFSGLEGLDLASKVTCHQTYKWDEMRWAWPKGFERQNQAKHKVVAIDYGAKRNILRCLASAGCEVTVLPASSSADAYDVWHRPAVK